MPKKVNRLVTKVQYNNFEPGEFEKEQGRTYDETISLIESYPWEKQRQGIHIDLTCSSITIQTDITTYLKLSLYYNGKFVLYFFDGSAVYSKSFARLNESYPFINDFFEQNTVNISAFKKENTIFKSISKHFVTNDFIYKVEAKGIWPYVDRFTRIILFVYILLLLYVIIKQPAADNQVLTVIVILMSFVLIGGVNLWLTINYYNHSKGMILQLSQGAKMFFFGNEANLKKFNKVDIHEIIIDRNTASKCPWNNFSLTTIYFKDGTHLKITSIMLDGWDIKQKFPGIKITENSPFIPFYTT